jgi:ABC-2 type transport system ATP-binding protein
MTPTPPPPDVDDDAIDVRDLRKTYRGRSVVDGLSLRVPRGSIAGFVGPNGAGKTTTLRLLLGLVRADAGRGAVLGEPFGSPATYLARVGSLVEGPALYPGMSARRNLTVLSRVSGLPATEVEHALAVAGLGEHADRPFRTLSSGTRQRLAIAAATLGGPELLILDEPVNGLDPVAIRDLRRRLLDARDAGVTVLLSSHLLGELERVCDWFVVIARGRRLAQGTAQDVVGRHGGTLEERYLDLVGARSDGGAR